MRSSMWEGGHCESPGGADVVEVYREGAYQVVRGRAVVDVVCPSDNVQHVSDNVK